MPIKLAINGYGRIGRNILRVLYETKRTDEHQIVAINDLADLESNAHLTKYDTTHGRFHAKISTTENCLKVDGDEIQVISERNPTSLPWKTMDIDVVLECTGCFASRVQSQAHLIAGAKKVLISAPAGNDVDATIVYGVNHKTLTADDYIVSNASCTTNCIAPVVKSLHEAIGIENGILTSVHSFTNDQVLVDVYRQDIRRARSATQSMIPTKTGAAAVIGLVLPELDGKLDAFAIRVPTLNVSVADCTFQTVKKTSVSEVNEIIRQAARGDLQGVLSVNELPLVSIDFIHEQASAIFDTTQTKVKGQLVKVLAWYDNEWGFANRMLDTALAMAQA